MLSALQPIAGFHVEAGKVADAINGKNKEQAEKLLAPGSRFNEASKQVSLAIVDLSHKIPA